MTDGGDSAGQMDDGDTPLSTTASDRGRTDVTDRRSVDKSDATPPELAEPRPSTVQTPRSRLDEETLKEYTTERRSLDPAVQIQWGIRTTIGTVVLGMILGAILSGLNAPPMYGAVAAMGLLLLGVVWVLLRYRVWVYQIREDSVYLERGVVTHVRTIVPYVRIQHVDTSRSALERALGLSTLVVYTAGSRGADVSVPGLEPDEARDLQQRLKELAIEAEGDDAL